MKLQTLFLLVVMFAMVSCSSDNSDQPAQAGKEQPAVKQVTQTEERRNSPEAETDLSKVNVCEVLPAEMVAAAVGGSALKPARRSDYGTTQGCEYDIDPSGADTYEYGAIWFGPPSHFADPQERMETDRGLGHEVSMEGVDGLGDKAYAIHNATEKQSIVYVLLEGRMQLEVKAERFEDAKKMAALALSRL